MANEICIFAKVNIRACPLQMAVRVMSLKLGEARVSFWVTLGKLQPFKYWAS
jgi:hypothetical protein